jgi:hypothetical protein
MTSKNKKSKNKDFEKKQQLNKPSKGKFKKLSNEDLSDVQGGTNYLKPFPKLGYG